MEAYMKSKVWKNYQYCSESQGRSEKVEIVLKGIHALISPLITKLNLLFNFIVNYLEDQQDNYI